MGALAVYTFFFLLCTEVTSDWIEIPQISVSEKSKFQNVSSLVKLTTLSTPLRSVFTEVVETATLSPILSEQLTKKKKEVVKQSSIKSLPIVKPPLKVTDLKIVLIRNATLTKTNSKEKPHILNGESKIENIKDRNDSDIIRETLEEAKRDLFNKPSTSLSQKLKYLHKMESIMSAQIKRLSHGLWTDRQARGKKLMGFASMEGALMTIAFLTFAVFLVKVVHQFIQGLQNSELAMVELPTAPALRLSRPKRQQEDLAAAQLLHYMDEFRIKHRICDSSS